jgi:hypothetical protein
VHHHALDPVRAAERGVRGLHVAGVDAGAHVRRGEGDVVAGVVRGQLHAVDREPEPGAEVGEHRDVPCGPMAEGEVPPDHDRGRVQALDQHLVGELGGRHAGELDGERQHQERVDAQLGDEVGAPPQAGEPGRMAAGADHLGRVRVEGDQHGGQRAHPRLGDRRGDQLLVSAVHTVEHPDRDDAASPPGRNAVQPTPPLHAAEPTERGGRPAGVVVSGSQAPG